MSVNNPEIGKTVKVNGYGINYLEHGDRANPTIIMLHGSGPGVTGYANWKLLIPTLENEFHVIAPDIVGFGYTEHPENFEYNLENWLTFVCQFMDAIDIPKAHFIGNSFGGALSLAMAVRNPERVDRLIMMGAAGIEFEVTPGLAQVWGYQPSLQAMGDLMRIFAYNQDLVSEDIVKSRYEASIREGYQETYQMLFTEPCQEKLDGLCVPEEEISQVPHHVLIVHGREDAIVPVECAIKANRLLQHSELHIYGECGHWTQVEKAPKFSKLVRNFLTQ